MKGKIKATCWGDFVHRCKQVAADILRAVFEWDVQFPLRNLQVPELQDSEATTTSSTPPASVCSFPCSLLTHPAPSSRSCTATIPFFCPQPSSATQNTSISPYYLDLRSPSRFPHSDTLRFWAETTSIALLLNLFAECCNLIRLGHLTKTNTSCCCPLLLASFWFHNLREYHVVLVKLWLCSCTHRLDPDLSANSTTSDLKETRQLCVLVTCRAVVTWSEDVRRMCCRGTRLFFFSSKDHMIVLYVMMMMSVSHPRSDNGRTAAGHVTFSFNGILVKLCWTFLLPRVSLHLIWNQRTKTHCCCAYLKINLRKKKYNWIDSSCKWLQLCSWKGCFRLTSAFCPCSPFAVAQFTSHFLGFCVFLCVCVCVCSSAHMSIIFQDDTWPSGVTGKCDKKAPPPLPMFCSRDGLMQQ